MPAPILGPLPHFCAAFGFPPWETVAAKCIIKRLASESSIASATDSAAVSAASRSTNGGGDGGAAPLISIRDLRFRRGSRLILDGVDVDIRRGAVTAVMGPSGCGKTTLLRLIGGQLRPLSGSVRVDGHEIARLDRAALMRLRRRMGVLFQSGALLTDFDVYDNVAFPLRENTDLPEPMIRDLVLLKLEAVGLRGAASLMPAQLSGGMARRVALARAVALDPMLIMYDEPFAGQDPITMGVLMRLIRRMNECLGVTSVVVSHDVAETCSIADYVYVLSGEGRLVGSGAPDELRQRASPWVRQFMEALPDGPVSFHYPAPALTSALLEEA